MGHITREKLVFGIEYLQDLLEICDSYGDEQRSTPRKWCYGVGHDDIVTALEYLIKAGKREDDFMESLDRALRNTEDNWK